MSIMASIARIYLLGATELASIALFDQLCLVPDSNWDVATQDEPRGATVYNYITRYLTVSLPHSTTRPRAVEKTS